jgi:hypothetical protein
MATVARRPSATRTGDRLVTSTSPSQSPSERLQDLAQEALEVAKKAKRHRKSLSGDNFYGNKLATLRADATNAFQGLASYSPGDTSTIAELVEAVFSATADKKARATAVRELCHSLQTTWRSAPLPREDQGIFPLSILTQANRGYLVTIGRQMNGCFTSGWYDAAAVMMRRLIEVAIIEAFEGKQIAAKIRDADGNYLHLSDLVARTLGESSIPLSRNAKKALPGLRDVGHMSAHGRYFTAKKEDVESAQPGCRVVVEELLHHAGLLK